MTIFLSSVFCMSLLLLFAGIVVFKEYQFYTILQAGYGVLYFGLLIVFLLALRRGAQVFILCLGKRVGRLAERFELGAVFFIQNSFLML